MSALLMDAAPAAEHGTFDVSAQMAYLNTMRKLPGVIRALHRCAELDARVVQVSIDSNLDNRARIVIDPPGDGTRLADHFAVHGECIKGQREIVFRVVHHNVLIEWSL